MNSTFLKLIVDPVPLSGWKSEIDAFYAPYYQSVQGTRMTILELQIAHVAVNSEHETISVHCQIVSALLELERRPIAMMFGHVFYRKF